MRDIGSNCDDGDRTRARDCVSVSGPCVPFGWSVSYVGAGTALTVLDAHHVFQRSYGLDKKAAFY